MSILRNAHVALSILRVKGQHRLNKESTCSIKKVEDKKYLEADSGLEERFNLEV